MKIISLLNIKHAFALKKEKKKGIFFYLQLRYINNLWDLTKSQFIIFKS